MNQAQGYAPVLRNRNFLKLWIAQICSLMALQSLLFVSLILIETVNQSGLQTAGVIVAFSLPAVIFGPIAGVFLDRVSKKSILVVSNLFRVGSQIALALLAYLGLTRGIDLAVFAVLLYLTIFFSSAIGQFFAPAEGATIPLVVRREDLYAANSLFTLTIVATQVFALVVYVPLSVKLFGLVGTFISLALFYVAATALLMLLPKDPVAHRVPSGDGVSALQRGWREIGEGWAYSLAHKPLFFAILQFALVFGVVSVLGEQAPGYSSRVLGLATEDAVFAFSPAGLGMILASIFVVRIGPRFPPLSLPIIGMTLMGIALTGIGALGLGGRNIVVSTVDIGGIAVGALWLIGILSPLAGIGLALVIIPAQTTIQEQASEDIRGRVLTVQLTLANALSIPLLILAGALSDVIGIPPIVLALGLLLFPLAAVSAWYARGFPSLPAVQYHTQPIPLPGETPAMLEEVADAAQPLGGPPSAGAPAPKLAPAQSND